MNTVKAKVEKIFQPTTKKDFTTQKVVIVWNENSTYPNKLVLEFGGEKKLNLVKDLKEGEIYTFYLDYRVNYWTNPNTNEETAFGSVSAWRIDLPVAVTATTSDGDFPF